MLCDRFFFYREGDILLKSGLLLFDYFSFCSTW